MSSQNARLTVSVEDYLKAVYALSHRGQTASTSAIAEALDVQPASVTGMVKRLAESGYVEHLPYKGVRLTELGLREALRVVRRHRIIETYLQIRLGYSWEDVHGEAERLEHAASDQLIERMDAALGSPTHDPHGAPIPTVGGEVHATSLVTLAEARDGSTVEIQAVQDEDSGRLQSMQALGLIPGARVSIQRRGDRDGVLTVTIGGTESPEELVAMDLARRIFVAPAED